MNLADGVTFKGIHSSTFHLSILETERPILPETKDTYIEIPHRDGSLLIPDDSKRDLTVRILFALIPPPDANLYEEARNVGNWLHSTKREPLIFDDDPTFIYNAKVVGNIPLERIVHHGRFWVDFRCSPNSL